jgi:hypothetical protein
MYYHSVPTAIVFMTMFLVWEILFSVIAWKLFVSWWQNKISTPEKTFTSGVANNTNITDNNQEDDNDSDKTWLDGRHGDAIERTLDDNVTTAESESEYEPVIKLNML